MKDDVKTPLPWALFAAELVGTAVLIAVGLSIVIVMFGAGSPLPQLIPSETLRRVITGLLFGSVGGLIAVSPVGRVSGAHINPAVTFGFWLMGKLDLRVGLGYVAAQLIGATIGAVPLLAWGEIGRSVAFGATVPGTGYSTVAALAGEAATTFGLVVALCFFLGIRELRRFTPAMIPILYGIMVPLEAAISGTSTNPARTLGPAIVSGQWDGWWIYWAGPLLGTLVATIVASALATRIEVAKLYHFSQDRGGIFHLMSRSVLR
jgi:aquaporin Z